MTLRTKGYLATLDGWRAIAILAVILDHGSGYFLQNRFPGVFAITRVGPNGVSLFFAISGFLICSRLLEEYERIGRISLSGFYIRRAARILPPAMAYLAFVGLLGTAGLILVSPREWLSSIFFFRNYLPPSLIHPGWGGYTVHYWSLAVEEHFYLLWPALLVFSGPKRARWVAAGLAIIVACWRTWDFQHHLVNRYLPDLLFGSRTDVRLDGLLMGCVLALFLVNHDWKQRFIRLMQPWLWVACVLGYVSLQLYYRRHYYTLLESTLLAVIVASTVLQPQTLIGRFLELGWIRWIGRLSYSLYLWQQLFLLPEGKYPLSLLQRFPTNCVLLFLVATLSYKFVERPMISIGHRLAPPLTPGRSDLETVTSIPLVERAPSVAQSD